MGGRGLAPLELPGGFWSRPDVGQALVQQEVGELFRLIAKYAGASQTQIGIAVGMSQGQVCMIIAGTRHVRAIDVVTRILEGLDAPDAARLAFGLAPRGPACAGAVVVLACRVRGQRAAGVASSSSWRLTTPCTGVTCSGWPVRLCWAGLPSQTG